MERVRRSVERDSVTLSATTSWLQSSLPIYGTVWAAVVIFPSCLQMPPPVSLMVVIVKMYFVCEANLQEDPRPPCSGVGCLVSLGHCWAGHRGQKYSGKIRALGGLWASPVNASSKVKAQPQRPVSSPGLFDPALWKRKSSCCSRPRPRSPAPSPEEQPQPLDIWWNSQPEVPTAQPCWTSGSKLRGMMSLAIIHSSTHPRCWGYNREQNRPKPLLL